MVLSRNSGRLYQTPPLKSISAAERRGAKVFLAMRNLKNEDVVTTPFVGQYPHATTVLYDGRAWSTSSRPCACPRRAYSKGKAIVNILPISDRPSPLRLFMPVDRDEKDWRRLQVVYCDLAVLFVGTNFRNFTTSCVTAKLPMKVVRCHGQDNAI